MLLILNILCIALYSTATAMVSLRWFHHDGPKHKSARVTLLGAVATHAVVLALAIGATDGQNLSILNVASLTAWLITLIIALNAFQHNQSFLVPLVSGFSAIVVLAAAVVPNEVIMHIELRPWILLHIILALLAYGSLTIALLYALQLAFIKNRLKQKAAFVLHSSLPPLMQVEQNLYKLLVIGTGLLTLSLITGFVFLEDMFEQRQSHKTILTSLAWLLYVGILFSHKKYGLRDHTLIALTVAGSVLLTLAYFGSRIVKEVFLG